LFCFDALLDEADLLLGLLELLLFLDLLVSLGLNELILLYLVLLSYYVRLGLLYPCVKQSTSPFLLFNDLLLVLFGALQILLVDLSLQDKLHLVAHIQLLCLLLFNDLQLVLLLLDGLIILSDRIIYLLNGIILLLCNKLLAFYFL
jgi:hypothetical protein